MKIKSFLTVLLLVLLVAACRNVQAQAAQEPADEANLDTQLFLIVGTNQDVDDAKLPAALDTVVKQLRATLPFKNYRLAATLINRVKNQGRLDLSWIGGPMASPTGAASNVTPSFSQFKVREVRLMRNAENQPIVQMLGFNFGARCKFGAIHLVRHVRPGDDSRRRPVVGNLPTTPVSVYLPPVPRHDARSRLTASPSPRQLRGEGQVNARIAFSSRDSSLRLKRPTATALIFSGRNTCRAASRI